MNLTTEQVILSILSGLLGSIMGTYGSVYIWILSRRSAKRDSAATAAGEWLSCAYRALEENYMLYLQKIRSQKSLAVLSRSIDSSESQQRHIEAIHRSNSETVSNYTSLFASLCKLHIECSDKKLVDDMHRFTLCLYTFPHGPDNLTNWLREQCHLAYREPTSIETLGEHNKETHALYMRDAMRQILVNFTNTSVNHFSEYDPLSVIIS